MYKLIRYLLFMFSAERAHGMVMFALKAVKYIPFLSVALRKYYRNDDKSLERTVFGLKFRNPVGFAAGFDKNAKVFETLGDLGFASVEIGTVTPLPQSGNPKPRCFRLVADHAIINRMGFNNDGLEAIAKRLQRRRNKSLIVGGNLGKNTQVANADAVNDYLTVFKGLYDCADYFTVNVSCPNIGNLRQLQDRAQLELLLNALTHERSLHTVYKPLLLKISPDLSFAQIDDTLEIIALTGIDGIVATNPTTSRDGLVTPAPTVAAIGNGGLSGKPLAHRSREIVHYIYEKTGGKLPIIAVGGIMNADDARAMLDAGASLIQLYTGYIYEGPNLIRQICKQLSVH
jgi:dihydroorotate dehydrogenase